MLQEGANDYDTAMELASEDHNWDIVELIQRWRKTH